MSIRPPGPGIRLPTVPALVVRGRKAVWVSPEGEIEELTPSAAGARAEARQPLVCHAPATAARLGLKRLVGHDLLELFAFVRPAKFFLPTARGLADAVGLPPPADLVAEAMVLRDAATLLLSVCVVYGRMAPPFSQYSTAIAAACRAALGSTDHA